MNIHISVNTGHIAILIKYPPIHILFPAPMSKIGQDDVTGSGQGAVRGSGTVPCG